MSGGNDVPLLSNIYTTKNLILRAFAGIYLVAFLSFYVQSDGNNLSPVQGQFTLNLHNFRLI